MAVLFLNVMAMVGRFGKPDLFITITCNPNQPDILASLLDGQTPAELISKTGANLATAASHVAYDLNQDFSEPDVLADLKYVKLDMENGVKHVLHVTGFTWHNASDVDLYTSVGHTVHKTLGGMLLAPTTFSATTAQRDRRLQLCGGICDGIIGGLAVNAITAGANYAVNNWG